MTRSLFIAGHDIVIVDATNITKDRRDFWLDEDWTTWFKEVNTDSDVCINRASQEGDKEIIPIIERMTYEYEPLDEQEQKRTIQSPDGGIYLEEMMGYEN